MLALLIASLYTLLSYQLPTAEAANPMELAAKAVCSGTVPRIELSWINPNGATSFALFRKPSLRGTQLWVSYAPSVPMPSYTDSAVSLGGTYSYQARAISPEGVIRYSNIVTVPLLACPTSGLAQAPTVPTVKQTFEPTISTSCTADGPTARLSWKNPNSATSFAVWRNPNGLGVGSWGIISNTSMPTYIDTTITADRAYRYQISATAPDLSVRYSDILSATTPSCSSVTPPTPTPVTPPTPSSPPPTTTPKSYQWGVYAGWSTNDIANFVTTTGENPDMVSVFIHWGNSNTFPSYLAPQAKDKGRTLIIFWEASNYAILTNNQAEYSYDAILRGEWDTYIRNFAAAAKAYGGPVILIPFSEANGNWSPWSGVLNGNTPAKAAEGYRYVHTVFGNVPNVKFGWAPNSNSVPNTAANAIELYYPGDAYVDYVGVDGFNFDNPWLTFDQIFRAPLTTLSKYNKPIYIFSFASAPGTQKAGWIRDAIEVQLPKYPLVVGWNWFNQNKERNWLVWSDDASLKTFQSVTP